MSVHFLLPFTLLLSVATTINAQTAHKTSATISRLKAKTNFNHGVENRAVDSSVLQYSGDRSYNAPLNSWAFDRKDEYNMLASAPANKMRTVQTFDNSGNIISSEVERYLTSSSVWQKQEKNTYTYSGSGQPLEQVAEYWDPSKNVWVKSFKFLKKFSNNLVTDSTLQAWDANLAAWVDFDKTVWTYDNQNRIVKILVKQYRQGAWKDMRAQINSYGTSFDKAYAIDLKTSDTIMRWTNHYDVSGQLIEAEYENKVASTWLTYYKITNTYDANGNLSEELEEQYNFNSSRYDSLKRRTMAYNSYNQVTVLTPERWDGSWAADVYYNPSNPNYQQRFYYEETFPSKVETVADEAVRLNIYPVPATGEITIEVERASPEDLVISICTMDGRLVKQWNQPAISRHYTETISIADIAAGNYLLNISSKEGRTGKQFSIMR